MPGLTGSEITKLVERYIGTTPDGYLCHFSYAKHERFYSLYCGMDLDVPAAREKYRTTRNTFIGILKEAEPRDQARIIRGIFEFLPPPEDVDGEGDKERLAVFSEFQHVMQRLESEGAIEIRQTPQTSKTVLHALHDAELLLSQRGPQSAIDRAHTALHGYLKSLCNDRGFQLDDTASMTSLFGIVRKEFYEFKGPLAHDAEAKRMLGSIAGALDSLNTIRNRASLAHPNELLVESPEAMLYINLSRTALMYLASRLDQDKT